MSEKVKRLLNAPRGASEALRDLAADAFKSTNIIWILLDRLEDFDWRWSNKFPVGEPTN